MKYNWDINGQNYNNLMAKYKFNVVYDFIFTNGENFFHRILDIAGGAGRYAIPLSKFTKDLTVNDINPTAIKLLKDRDSSIQTVCGDYLTSEFKGTYSLIISIEALGYFNDIERFFIKTSSLLNDDGRFIFTYNNPNSWRFVIRKIKHWKDKNHPYREIKIADLKKILLKCNLEVICWKGMNWMPLSTSSNSKLVNVFGIIEKILRLNKWISQSPWIIIALQKKINN